MRSVPSSGSANEMTLPTFIIAGAMRCGTSSLNAYLREHPDIAVSQPKELHFFDLRFDRGLDWYKSRFPGSEHSRAAGEATPDYLYDPEAMTRLAMTLPEIRILILLRDPADRAHSHYWHNRSVGKEQLAFEAAVDAEQRRISADPVSRAAFSYVDRGRYAVQLKHLFARVPTERVLIQTFNELQDDPVSLFRRTCEFIDVDNTYLPESLGRPVNAYVEYRSPSLRNLGKSLPRPLRNVVGRLNRTGKERYENMPGSIRRSIHRTLAEDTSELARMLDIEIPWQN